MPSDQDVIGGLGNMTFGLLGISSCQPPAPPPLALFAGLCPGYPLAIGFTKSIKFCTFSGDGLAVASCLKLHDDPRLHIPNE
jgi:hypothetical protein